MPSGVLAGECVVEAVHQHRIEDVPVTHAITPTSGAHEIGRPIHVLHAAGDCAIDKAKHDLLRRARNRLSARAAHAIDRHRRNIDRHAAVDGRLPCRVHFVAGLDHIAHDDGIDFARWQFRTIERRTDDHGTEIGRRHILERAAVRADRQCVQANR